jgi:hypothetical protein
MLLQVLDLVLADLLVASNGQDIQNVESFGLFLALKSFQDDVPLSSLSISGLLLL